MEMKEILPFAPLGPKPFCVFCKVLYVHKESYQSTSSYFRTLFLQLLKLVQHPSQKKSTGRLPLFPREHISLRMPMTIVQTPRADKRLMAYVASIFDRFSFLMGDSPVKLLPAGSSPCIVHPYLQTNVCFAFPFVQHQPCF